MRRAFAPVQMNRITVSVDIGGTFTDVVVQRGREVVESFKVPTTLAHPERGVLGALERSTSLPADTVVHATTLATNLLLDRSRAALPSTGLVTTKGFRDVIEIGRQNRAELYNLHFERPRPLVERRHRYELAERVGPGGIVERTVRNNELRQLVDRIHRDGLDTIAICFLHSYANSSAERIVARALRRPGTYVSVSSEVAPEPREFERTSTTVVNATLMPLISEYLGKLEQGLAHRGVRSLSIMSSAGGLITTDEARRRPVQVIESGPAAGVIAAAHLARLTGLGRVISFDMGGTTAKAGTIEDGAVTTTSEFEVGGDSHHGRRIKGSGYPILFPFVDLAEVSAGGGTVISRDPAGGLTIGPRSAGAVPGPACYGQGGTEPTLTDANLVLGILGNTLLGGELQLNPELALRSLRTFGPPMVVAERAIRLAELEMARAVRIVTVERGLDPSGFALVAFGGGGPQHAARIAAELGVRRVVIPPHPGLFSALGLLCSDWVYEERLSFPKDLKASVRRLEQRLRRRYGTVRFRHYADCRYTGQGSELRVPLRTVDEREVRRQFEGLHESTFGFRLRRPVEIVTVRVFGETRRTKPSIAVRPSEPPSGGTRRAILDGRWTDLRTYARGGLAVGRRVSGPCVIDDYDSTIFVPGGWVGAVGSIGQIALSTTGGPE
jgi:N-methylhydantoinase A